MYFYPLKIAYLIVTGIVVVNNNINMQFFLVK